MNAGALSTALQPLLGRLERHLTAQRLLWLLTLLCFLIAWNRGIALLYGLFALLAALLLISWVLPWWAMRSVQLQRWQQGDAVAGGNVMLAYRLHSPRPQYFLHLLEQLPGQPPQGHFLPQLQPEQEWQLPYACARRGVFSLPPTDVRCAWPFGFVERRHRTLSAATTLTVLPHTFPIRRLPQPLTDNPVMEGADSFLSRGAHSEFAGVRPYRDGDSLRQVHWAASARQQQLVVREYHSYDTPSWLVVVDGQAGSALGEGTDTTFEYAIQMAASLLQFAARQQLSLTVVVGCAQPLRLTVTAGMRDIRPQLEALAAVQDDGALPYQQVLEYELSQHAARPVLITVRRQSQALQPHRHSGHIDIVYADDSFVHPLRSYREGWQDLGPVQRLHLHRRSQLAQEWA